MDAERRGRTGTLHRLIWAGIATTALADLWVGAERGFSAAWLSFVPALAGFALIMAVAVVYARVRPDPRIASGAVGLAELVAITAVAAPLSYMAASLGGPLWDARLLAWDQALGLDWLAFFRFAVGHPHLVDVLSLSYASMVPMIILVVLVLSAHGRPDESTAFVASFFVAVLVTILFSALMPALDAYTHLGLGAADHRGVAIMASTEHLHDLAGLRDGSLRRLDLSTIMGIICFPSLHAASGMLCILAAWRIRWLRAATLLVSGTMILSTPIAGSHYFVDTIAGVALAVAAFGLCLALRVGMPARLAPSSLLVAGR